MATKKTSDLTVGEILSRFKWLSGKLKLRKLIKWTLILLVLPLVIMNGYEAQINAALAQITPKGQPAPTVGMDFATLRDGVTGAVGDVFGWLGPAGVVIIALGIALLVVVTKLLNMKVDPDTGKPVVKKPESTTPDPTTPPATS